MDLLHKSLPQKTNPDSFAGKFYQTLEEVNPIICEIFQKIEEERISYSYYEASIILIAKNKDITRKLYINIPHEHTHRTNKHGQRHVTVRQ